MPVDVEIKLNGRALTEAAGNALLEVRTELGVGTTGFAQLRFADIDDVERCPVGTEITIAVGSVGAVTQIFVGTVRTLSIELGRRGRPELTIDAYDASYDLGRSTGLVTHQNVTVADVISKIAREAKLTVKFETSLSAHKFPVLQQTSTPQQFLNDATRMAGCEWLIDGEDLVIRRRDGGAKVTVTTDDLIGFAARFSATDSVGDVEVRGWDPTTKQEIKATASAGTAPNVDVAKSNWAERTTGKAVDYARPMASVRQATDRAESIIAEMEANAMTGRGHVEVNPAIMPGVTLVVEGVDDEWNGEYYVTGVEHVMIDAFYLTYFTFGALEPADMVDLLGSSTAASIDHLTNGFTIGLVTNVRDPEGLSRVKVRLPYVSDETETDWARVIQQGGGAGRGWSMLPEVDDEVVVAFEHGDVNRPIIVGGLWNGVDAPPIAKMGDDGTIASRSFTSRTGHEMMFSDVGDSPDKLFVSITLGDSTTKLFVGQEKIELHADKSPIEIKTGQAQINLTDTDVTVKAKNITLDASGALTLKAGADVEVDAGAKLSMNGVAGSELKGAKVDVTGQGPVAIKGSMVQVN